MSAMNHHARYDDAGNIILPDEPVKIQYEKTEGSTQEAPKESNAATQPVIERPNRIREWLQRLGQWCKRMLGAGMQGTKDRANAMVQESVRQYKTSATSLKESGTQYLRSSQETGRGLWNFLSQPVWVLKPKRRPKQYSRMTLFGLDVIRFGTTFALIFGILFVGLNYQSFGQILTEKINPLRFAQQALDRETSVDSVLKKSSNTLSLLQKNNREKGNLISFLPTVGPPDNRIIIPKLNLNVPLVTPRYDALLREDWDQVEVDIQDALQSGVVHYPGTARPGQAGNFFITGHSSYYPWEPGQFKTVFALLHKLEPGDEYHVYYGGDHHKYVVQSKKEVKPTNVEVLNQPIGQRISTLMTCTPIGTTLRRLILVAQEVDPNTNLPLAVGENSQPEYTKINAQTLPI